MIGLDSRSHQLRQRSSNPDNDKNSLSSISISFIISTTFILTLQSRSKISPLPIHIHPTAKRRVREKLTSGLYPTGQLSAPSGHCLGGSPSPYRLKLPSPSRPMINNLHSYHIVWRHNPHVGLGQIKGELTAHLTGNFYLHCLCTIVVTCSLQGFIIYTTNSACAA